MSDENAEDFISKTQKVLDAIRRWLFRWQIHISFVLQVSHAIHLIISGSYIGAAISLTMPLIIALIYYRDRRDKARRRREMAERELARKLAEWGPGGYQVVDAVNAMYKLKLIEYGDVREVALGVEKSKDQWNDV